MSAESMRTGPVIGPPLEYTTQDRLLAEIKAELVELVHEMKRQNEMLGALAEIERKLALTQEGAAHKLEKILVLTHVLTKEVKEVHVLTKEVSLQTHVVAVQLGRVLSVVETWVEHGGA